MSPAQDGRSAARFRITGGSDASSRPTRPRLYPLNWPCLCRIRHACPLFSPSASSYHKHGPSIRLSTTHAIPTLSLIFDSCLIIYTVGTCLATFAAWNDVFTCIHHRKGFDPGHVSHGSDLFHPIGISSNVPSFPLSHMYPLYPYPYGRIPSTDH